MIELLIAMAIGAFGIAIAARMVRTAVRSTGRGNQQTEMLSNARLLGAQFRADLDLAGLGSTGAITVDASSLPWSDIAELTPGAQFPAIPAVRGGNNVTGSFSGRDLLLGSDVVQVVVPDPSTLQTTDRTSPAGRREVFIEPPDPPCALLYITDHSAPNGAGRTQLARVDVAASSGTSTFLQDDLAFPVYEASDVMCARLSTYWVDSERWLHRTDLGNGATERVGSSGLRTTPSDGFADRVVYGAEDLQLAYRFSSELTGRGAGVEDRWAFDNLLPGTGLDVVVPTRGITAWFEVRQVRWTLLLRTARAVEERGHAAPSEGNGLLEDRTTPVPIDVAYGRHYLKTSAALVNLRFFDQSAPRGLPAEPY